MDLNNIIKNFNYGTESSAVPSQIPLTVLQSADKTRLGQTGKHMLKNLV